MPGSGGQSWSTYEPFVEKVVFVIDDDMPPDEIAALYHMADCYVSPYKGEGFNLPVLEAMASGLPVVVTAGGSTDDFIYRPSAVTIPSREVDMRDYPGGTGDAGTVLVTEQVDIINSMIVAMNQRMKLAAAARSRGARAHLERYTWSAVTKKLMDELGKVVAGSREGSAEGRGADKGQKKGRPPAARVHVEAEDEEDEEDEEEDEDGYKGYKGRKGHKGRSQAAPAHGVPSSIKVVSDPHSHAHHTHTHSPTPKHARSIKVLSDLAALASEGRGGRAARGAAALGRVAPTAATALPGDKKTAKGGSVGTGSSGSGRGSGRGAKNKPHTPPARTKARRRRKKKRPQAAAVAAATDEL